MSRYKPASEVVGLSTVFQRGKTQIPARVRRLLGVKDGDRILWINRGGEIVVKNALGY